MCHKILCSLFTQLDGEDEQVKKRKKRYVWMKPWLRNRLGTSTYQNIFEELRLKDKEEYVELVELNCI